MRKKNATIAMSKMRFRYLIVKMSRSRFIFP